MRGKWRVVQNIYRPNPAQPPVSCGTAEAAVAPTCAAPPSTISPQLSSAATSDPVTSIPQVAPPTQLGSERPEASQEVELGIQGNLQKADNSDPQAAVMADNTEKVQYSQLSCLPHAVFNIIQSLAQCRIIWSLTFVLKLQFQLKTSHFHRQTYIVGMSVQLLDAQYGLACILQLPKWIALSSVVNQFLYLTSKQRAITSQETEQMMTSASRLLAFGCLALITCKIHKRSSEAQKVGSSSFVFLKLSISYYAYGHSHNLTHVASSCKTAESIDVG